MDALSYWAYHSIKLWSGFPLTVVCLQGPFEVQIPIQSYFITSAFPKAHPPPPLWHGKAVEPVAAKTYTEMRCDRDVRLQECGLFIHPEYGFLGASPDGLVTDPHAIPPNGLLEIKCPQTHRECAVKEACDSPGFYCTWDKDGPQLKHSSDYYYQVQGQLAVTGCQWCDFVVYTFKDITIERIYFDEDFWMDALVKLEEFYTFCVLPMFVHRAGPCEIYKL